MRFSTGALLGIVTTVLSATSTNAATNDTSMPGVAASIAFVRQHGGILRVGVLFKNGTNKAATRSEALKFSEVVLVDAAAKRKHYAMKDADKRFLAGPVSDWNEGGRWFPNVGPNAEVLVWAMFEAVPAGAKLSLEMPVAGTFDALTVADAPSPAQRLTSSQTPVGATLVSATRSAGQLRVQIKVDNPDPNAVAGGAALVYQDVYALDPIGKRRFPLLKGQTGLFLGEPRSDNNDGGRYFLSQVRPNSQVVLNLTFQPPPDSVNAVDLVLPHFPPFESVAIAGAGGAAQSGVAVAGRSEALEQAMKDLNAAETPVEIKVNLSADVLFDFDKASLKPEAEASLQRVATVIKAHPKALVVVEGHTDGKGTDRYNQPLSEQRAEAVGKWLLANAGLAVAQLQTRGWGRSKPVAANARPDGKDDPVGRQKNRRVEIVVKK